MIFYSIFNLVFIIKRVFVIILYKLIILYRMSPLYYSPNPVIESCLHTKEILSKKEILSLRSEVKSWKSAVHSKMKLIPKQDSSYVNLKYCGAVLKDILDEMKQGKVLGEKRILICQDNHRRIQAIALINDSQEKEIILEQLCTNPDNIRCSINETITTRVKGAASAIIQYLSVMALEKKKSISADALQSSLPFYKKLKFDVVDLTQQDSCIVPIRLTLEKIDQWLRK